MELLNKPLEVKFSAKASLDLVNIVYHISKTSRTAAHNQRERILARIDEISEFPGSGKPAQARVHAARGVRYTSEGKYYIYYRVEGTQLRILHVRHSARRAVTSRDLFETNE